MSANGQVFGPGRPAAAVRAIADLQAAEREAQRYSLWPPAHISERLRQARAAREAYAEYGDSFRGH